MVKKVIFGVVGVVVLGTLVYGTSFFGLMRTAKDEIQRAAKDAIPMSVQLADAERDVRELKDELSRWAGTVAEQQVTVKNMGEKIAKRQTDLDGHKKQILALKSEVDKNEKQYVFDGTTYTQEQVRNDLDVKFRNFKNIQNVLARDEEQLKSRKETLANTEAKFQEMVTMKKELENEVSFLRDKMNQMKADEAVGTLEIDDSKMAEARKKIEELRTKLEVQEKVREAQGRLKTSEIKISEKPNLDNISQDIEKFFGDEAKEKSEL